MHPAADDPDLAQRPSPSRKFYIPMDFVGDFLMVWDFCCSFGRLLQLSPFSLDDFENALCHKESYVVLIVETHSAFLSLLMNDDGEYLSATRRNKRKPKVKPLKKFQIFSPFYFINMYPTWKFGRIFLLSKMTTQHLESCNVFPHCLFPLMLLTDHINQVG